MTTKTAYDGQDFAEMRVSSDGTVTVRVNTVRGDVLVFKFKPE